MGELTTYFKHIEKQTQIKDISAIVADSTLSFGVWDTKNFLVQAGTFGNFTKNVHQTLKKEIGDYPIKVLTNQTPFLLIETKQISENNRKGFFQHLTPDSLMDLSSIRDYSFNNQKTSLLFGVKNASLSTQKCGHLMAALGDVLLDMETANTMILHIENDTLSIVAKSNQKLCFVNQFQCRSQVDFLYYPELVAQQFNFDKKALTLHYTGRVGEDSNIVKLLQQYFHKVSPLIIEEKISDRKDFNLAHFQDLYLAQQCG